MRRVTDLRIAVLSLEQAVREGDGHCCGLQEIREALLEARRELALAEAALTSRPAEDESSDVPLVRTACPGAAA
jgi:hypothetical protein